MIVYGYLVSLLRGKGLELRSASSCEAKPKQKSFLFLFLGEEGDSTYGLLAATSEAK